ncbi:MAG TPA: patatin-like phospholipase family protein [Pyrinomonadaceae bacterium]
MTEEQQPTDVPQEDDAALDPASALEPVEATPGDQGKLIDGIALCLSGGGYRAMLFHLGALWRLNELGYLPKLHRVSSVSGGSITAAVLAMNWAHLGFDAANVGQQFNAAVVDPIRQLGGKTIDVGSVVSGALMPGSIGDKVTHAYRKYLFGEKTLQDIPDMPSFIINATNVQSGSLWRFTKPYMRDWQVGEVKNPKIELAVAVAASSAFPPVLSPLEMELEPGLFTEEHPAKLQHEPFTTDVVLTDGGVYDNLGLETAWKRYATILVSDGGGNLEPEAEPKKDWVRHTLRVLFIIDNQVRSLRKRQVIASYKLGTRKGTYWGIRSDIAKYNVKGALNCPFEKSLKLANVGTRLKRLEPETQEQLINWGYAICDAGMRRHVDAALPPPTGFPYPEQGIG